jgi:hypothetical protein
MQAYETYNVYNRPTKKDYKEKVLIMGNLRSDSFYLPYLIQDNIIIVIPQWHFSSKK